MKQMNNKLKVKAIIFDLDDTLYPEKDYIESAYYDISQQISKDFRVDSCNILQKFLLFREKYGDSSVLQRIMEYVGVENSKDYILNTLVPIYHNCSCTLNLFKDAEELLSIIHKNISIGVITNGGTHTQRNKLKLLDIENVFDCIIVTGEHFEREHWKPDPKPFELCLKQLNLDSKECIYIGNNPKYDVLGAYNVGLKVFIRDLERKNHDNIYSDKYIELESLLNILTYISL